MTVLAVALAVPALLAGRMIGTKSAVDEVQKLRVQLKNKEKLNSTIPASSPSAETEEQRQKREAQSLATALSPLASPSSDSLVVSRAVRFFFKAGGDSARTVHNTGGDRPGNAESRPADSTPSDPTRPTPSGDPQNESNATNGNGGADPTTRPSSGGSPIILPPIAHVNDLRDGNVRLTWEDHAATPTGTIFKSQIYRWNDTEPPAPIFITPAYVIADSGGASDSRPAAANSHEFVDNNVCGGIQYSYAVLAIQFDKLEGVEVRRSSLGERVIANIPVRYKFEILGFVKKGALAHGINDAFASLPVRMRITDFADAKPAARETDVSVDPSGDVGQALHLSTGWSLIKLEREDREQNLEVAIPIFNADGSRRINGGSPASEKRMELQKRMFPVATMMNRCGRQLIVRAVP